jgi:hypothetical protein
MGGGGGVEDKDKDKPDQKPEEFVFEAEVRKCFGGGSCHGAVKLAFSRS